MKKVLIIRHAKSDWGGIGVRDFDRGLNARGLRDAPEMADRIIKKQIAIDAFISSTAKRAFTTASFFVHAYNAANKTSLNIIEEPTLYHAPPEIFYEIINFKPYNIILYNITKTLIFNVQICSLLCKYQSHNSLK